MSIRELFEQARAGLLTHRLRATLSVIGVIVGISTVVASLAIGNGARRAALADIGALGVDNVFVRSVVRASDPKRPAAAPTLTVNDEFAIAAMAGIETVSSTRVARGELAMGARGESVAVAGVTSTWARIAGIGCARGRWLSAEDVSRARRVAVLGPEIARTVAPNGDAVGRSITLDGQFFVVVGVLQASRRGAGASAIQSVEPERSVLVPLSAMDRSIGAGDSLDRVSEIVVRASRGSDVEQIAKSIAGLLSTRHHGLADPFELVVPREILRTRLRAQRTFDVVLLSTGFIALIIAGVGIMNVMLASVAERRPEIGVRLAVGARRRDVIGQFTVEAALLCLGGGIVGAPLGGVFAWLVAVFAGWPVAISVSTVALALGLAASVGLTFGIYPAYLAASNDPVDALRA